MSDQDKTRTMAGLGALPPGKRMVLVEHSYTKQYTDYFYTIVDDTQKLPSADQQVEHQMNAGALESFDYDETESEDYEIKTETVEFDVANRDMTDAVSRWVEYTHNKKEHKDG